MKKKIAKTHQNIKKKSVTCTLLIFANGFILEFQNQKKTLTCGSSVHLRKMKMLDMWEVANIETIFQQPCMKNYECSQQ